MPPQTQFIQANNININNNYMPVNGNCNDKKLLRLPQQQQQQYKYLDRRSLFPPETKEEYYSGVRQVNLINLINFLKLRLTLIILDKYYLNYRVCDILTQIQLVIMRTDLLKNIHQL